MTRVFISDCEGPISKNDNAYEMTSHFVPDGGKLFTVISRYDDVLAGIMKRAHYEAGDTLKLILPFLKAYDVTDEKMRQFSARNLLLIPSAKDTLQHVRNIAPAFIVSTSYEHYIQALCRATEFPYENTYSTKLNLDMYHVENERSRLREIAREIARMPTIEIPHSAKSLDDLSREDQKMIRRLDAIFWEDLSTTECEKIFAEVNPVGGEEKAETVRHVVQELDTTLSDTMYVGDSITDEKAFKLVKKNDGLTLSFNGNQYAVNNAEIAVLSENSTVTAVIADIFVRFGKQQALDLVEDWSFETLKRSKVDGTLLERLFRLFVTELPKVKILTSENMEILARESTEFRGRVRGKSIGSLG